ncbi:ABC transporter substrate-binding protein, partial [Candidatus Bipolaricaulota bacterium]|nr:ABC transporter substrate-binding protein [Candidatus Bipolaricaulota bacterium]
SEAYDEAVEKFVKEWDLAKARDYCFEAQAIIAEELPYVILFDTPLIEAYRGDRIIMPFDHALDGLQGVDGCQATAELIE